MRYDIKVIIIYKRNRNETISSYHKKKKNEELIDLKNYTYK